MDKTPAISVIMPVYNAGHWLAPAVESVLGQTFGNLELIMVDDVSTDGSLEAARGFAERDSRVRVMTMERNGGPGIARNRGIEAARGEYVGFMDSDDIMPPDAFMDLYSLARKEDLDIVRGAMAEFSDSQPEPRKIPPSSPTVRVFRDGNDLRQMALCSFDYPVRKDDEDLNFGAGAWAALFRSTLFSEEGVRFSAVPHAISEDFLFCYECLMKSRSAGVVPEIVYHYRTNPGSRSHLPAPDLIERALHTAEEMDRMIVADGFRERDREYAMRYAIDIIRAFVKNFFLSDMPVRELRRWFAAQHSHPFVRRCHDSFPLELLPRMHRVSFEAFCHVRFWQMYAMVHGREMLRRVLGMRTASPESKA